MSLEKSLYLWASQVGLKRMEIPSSESGRERLYGSNRAVVGRVLKSATDSPPGLLLPPRGYLAMSEAILVVT